MGKQSGKIRDLILNALPESLTLNGIDYSMCGICNDSAFNSSIHITKNESLHRVNVEQKLDKLVIWVRQDLCRKWLLHVD